MVYSQALEDAPAMCPALRCLRLKWIVLHDKLTNGCSGYSMRGKQCLFFISCHEGPYTRVCIIPRGDSCTSWKVSGAKVWESAKAEAGRLAVEWFKTKASVVCCSEDCLRAHCRRISRSENPTLWLDTLLELVTRSLPRDLSLTPKLALQESYERILPAGQLLQT